MKITLKCLLLAGMFMIGGSVKAQEKRYDLEKLLNDGRWSSSGHIATASSDAGKKGVHFDETDNEAFFWIDEVHFQNGTIEIDIKGRDLLQRSFVGVAFHAIDDHSSDIVYFRPFNFRSPDSVRKIHAVQYVSVPDFGWQRLREEQNGKYEKGITTPPAATDWFHARIVVNFPTITVFVNNNAEPSLTVSKLNSRKDGKFGLWIGPGADGSFANLKITPR